MPLSFHCEVCRRSICVPDGSEGQKVYCPECYMLLTVPYRSGEPPDAEDPFRASPEDPLGISDPENLAPQAEASRSQQANPFAATVASAAPPPSPSPSPQATELLEKSEFDGGAFLRTRRNLMIVSIILMVGNVIAMLLLLVLALLALVKLMAGATSDPFFIAVMEPITLFAMALLHLPTLYGLNQARTLKSFRWARNGFLLAMLPCTNYAVCLVLPGVVAVWGLLILYEPAIRLRVDDSFRNKFTE